MPWVNDGADRFTAPASGTPEVRAHLSGVMDAFERVRQERRLAALFLTGFLMACAAVLWLFHGSAVIQWILTSGNPS